MNNQSLEHRPSQALIIAAFAALYILWGSTYLAILIAVKHLPPFLLAGVRFIVAGVLLYIWCKVKGQSTPRLNSFMHISFSGILMLFLGTGSLVWVEQYISSGLAAIIVATVPLWLIVLDKKHWKENFTNIFIILGLLIGFGGVLTLFAGNKKTSLSGDSMQLISVFVMLAGSVAWAAGSLYSKYKQTEGTTTIKAAIQMMAAGVVALIVALLSGEMKQFSWNNVSTDVILAVLYLITFGSLIGFMAYIWLLSVRPPALVGTYAYVNPVVAVFLGWLIAGEPITTQQVIALVVILAGVIIANLSKDKIPRS